MKKSLQVLQEFNLELLRPNTPRKVYSLIAEYAQKISNADACSIFLIKKNRLLRVFTNVPSNRRINPRPGGFTHRAIQTGEAYIYTPKILHASHPEIKGKVQCIAIVPIKYDKKLFGIITLQRKDKTRFRKHSLKALEVLSAAASLAIDKSELLYELQKAVKARDLFISAASHELKTPLTVVQLYSKLLTDAVKEGKQIDPSWVEKINRHTTLLTRVISDFLQAESYTQQNLPLKYHIRQVDVVKLVRQIVETARSIYPEREITFSNHSGKHEIIMADSERITQLVNNLINNATKFSNPHKPIDISLSVTGSDICIEINDYGMGIKEQDMKFLFNRYYQGADGKSEGMGIGLYVCKIIADKHDGVIQIKSKEKKGTKVSVFLPLKLHA